jgi:lipid-binding SYLF domain-containing protein
MRPKLGNVALAALLVTAVFPLTSRAAEDLKVEAQQAIADLIKADSSLKKFFDDSAGYAIFPSVGKGGLIIGGARGKGLVYEKGKIIGEATMTQATIGAQVGGQTFTEVIFFETPAALQDFKESKFEMSAEISAVVAAEGAAKAAKYQQGVAVFTLPKSGLMVQAAVGGQKFKFEPIK